MELRIQRQDSGAVAVLAVYGELDLDGGPQRRQALLQVIDDNHGLPSSGVEVWGFGQWKLRWSLGCDASRPRPWMCAARWLLWAGW